MRLGQGLFKSDYITQYLHNWVGYGRVQVKGHVFAPYIVLISGGATTLVRSRSNFFCGTDNANFVDCFCSIAIDAHDGHTPKL